MWPNRFSGVMAVMVGLFLLALADVSGFESSRAPEPTVDRQGDAVPPGAIRRIGTTRFRHGSPIQTLAYAPDGKTLAAAGGDDIVRLWEADSGKLKRTFKLTNVAALAFSKSGKLLAAGGAGKEIFVWDIETGQVKGTLTGHNGPVTALAFAVDDAVLVSAGHDKTVRVWNFSSNSQAHLFEGHSDEVLSLAVSPDGNSIASGSGDFTIRLWNARGGQPGQTLDTGAAVTALAFDSTGKNLIAGGDDGSIRLLDAAPLKETKNWKAHQDAVLALRLSKEGKLVVSAGADSEIAAWDLPVGQLSQKFNTLPGDSQALALGTDGDTVAFAGLNCTIHRRSLGQKKELDASDLPQGAIVSLSVSPDEKLLAYAESGGTVCLLDNATQKEVHRWQLAGTTEPLLAFAPDGKMLAASTGAGAIQLWDVPGGKEHPLITIPAPEKVECLVFAPNGKSLAVGYQKTGIRFLDIAGAKWGKTIVHPGGIYALAFPADGSLVAGAGPDKVTVWKTGSGEKLVHVAQKQRAASVAFAPDGKTLATGHFNSMIHLWNLADPAQPLTLEGHTSAVYALTFSTTGRRLLSGSYDKSVRVWEPFSGGQVVSWTGQTGPVYCAAFSSDGRRAYTGSGDTSIVVWDVTQRSPTGKLPPEQLNAGPLDVVWADLASADPVIADKALWKVIAAGDDGVKFVAQHVALVDRDEINKFIDDLNSDKYDVRIKATKSLEKFGILIKGRLKEAADKPISLEQKLRLDQLLGKLESEKGLSLDQERFRYRRAMEILEQVGTPEAQKLLTRLIKGAAENNLGEEAAQSLKRLEKNKG